MTETNSSVAQTLLPAWRGFNLVDLEHPIIQEPSPRDTTEDDFRWMSDWGFDFIRLPMAYPRWVDYDQSKPITKDDIYKIKESTLDQVDKFVELGQKYSLHVSLNFHRGPGYCVNAGFQEPFDLWNDREALDALCYYWGMFGKRYRDIPPSKISFNLLNEPSVRDLNDQNGVREPVPGDTYRAVVEASMKAIRESNSDHLIISDGNNVGREVIHEIADLDIAQSCRSYYPVTVSHYNVPWLPEGKFPEPVWPDAKGDEYWDGGGYWDRARLERFYEPWVDLARKGVGVHCGECGCFNLTPHEVLLSWFGDVVDILRGHGIGYAMWNFRGEFGVMDSGRTDVEYEDWFGHKLDRKLLELMRE